MPGASDLPVGVILAGGAGRRIGGDKPFRLLGGRPLIEHVIDRLRPQVGELWISARGNAEGFARHGVRLIHDRATETPGGALAGIVAAVDAAATGGLNCVATAPCDTPFLPDDLIARLTETLRLADAPAIVVRSAGRMQPTIGVWRIEALGPLSRALAAGRRTLGVIAAEIGVGQFEAATAGWAPESFLNINPTDDLVQANGHLRGA